jgi:hypothetical protein
MADAPVRSGSVSPQPPGFVLDFPVRGADTVKRSDDCRTKNHGEEAQKNKQIKHGTLLEVWFTNSFKVNFG